MQPPLREPGRVTDVDWSRLRRTVVPADGADLACWHRPGDGTRWVLWVHGACADHRTWGHQVDAFPGWDHLFLDLRGHGQSPVHVGRRVAFEDVVDDLVAVLDAHGAERAVLVGHSWGGNPVQELAHRSPHRVTGLVLVGSWGQLRSMPAAELRRIRVMAGAYRVVPWRLVAAVNSRVCSDVPETRRLVAELLRDTGRRVFLDLGLSAYAAVHDVDAQPAVPTLLVRGALDAPEALAGIYAGIVAGNPAAREVVIPGTRHVPMVDAVADFDAALAGFLEEVRTR